MSTIVILPGTARCSRSLPLITAMSSVFSTPAGSGCSSGTFSSPNCTKKPASSNFSRITLRSKSSGTSTVGVFSDALACEDQRRRLHLLDEGDRRALRVDLRIVVYRGAEVRDHPAVDVVLAVVALPVADAGAGHRRLEALRLRDRPHRHVAA